MSLHPDFLARLRLPLIAAPMFTVSGPELVIACCRNGIVGALPSLNNRSSAGFDAWLTEINHALAEEHQGNARQSSAPYAVNLIVHSSNARLEDDLHICIRHEVPVIITSLGANAELIEKVHEYGGIVYHDVINRRHAEKAAAADVDGLILVCSGAGGHTGALNPFAFINEVRSFFNKTLILAGSLTTGRDIASAMLMGADLVYMGTRFINTNESLATVDYQQMIIDADSREIVSTAAVSGITGNFLRQSLDTAGLAAENRENAVKSSVDVLDLKTGKAWNKIWSAGQGVALIREVQSVANLVGQLQAEFATSLEQSTKVLNRYR